MSAPSESTTAETVDRSVAATRQLCDELALGILKPKDLKLLSTALMEAASIEAGHNTAFRACILKIYGDLKADAAPKSASTRGGASKTKSPMTWLTPINPVDPKRFGPDKLLDPYLIQYAYGDDNLRLILNGYTPARLKEAVSDRRGAQSRHKANESQ